MSTNQNTIHEDLKKCSQKKKRLNKCIAVLTLLLVITSIISINASAIVIQDITDTLENLVPYPTLTMEVETENNTGYIEVSGAGKETGSVTINSTVGQLKYQSKGYTITHSNAENQIVKLGEITTVNGQLIRSFTNSIPLNIDMWEWYDRYEDSIIWQIWATPNLLTIRNIEKFYEVKLPYFNNSAIMGTEPLDLYIEGGFASTERISSQIYAYNLDLPSINTIVEKAIEIMEDEGRANITFQYKGEALINNNYITDVYAEDGTKTTIDFKKALSTVIIRCGYYIENDVTQISLVNYNDTISNQRITDVREEFFNNLMVLNQFERSAEITIDRQEKEVGLLNWLGNAISGIMNVEIFPNFSLGAILSVMIMIPIILWILKLVAGG